MNYASISKESFLKLKKDLNGDEIVAFQVVSGSMEPLIMTGSTITVVPALLDELKRFDILVFWDGTRLICHYLWHQNQSLQKIAGERTFVTRPLGWKRRRFSYFRISDSRMRDEPPAHGMDED